VRPIVTPLEMGAIDRAAPEPVEMLIDRAGAAVAWAARRLLGGTYGRRVVVVAGQGNNGNDGRVAAQRLRRWGVQVRELELGLLPDRIPVCDLVLDAALGTGIQRPYHPPANTAPVLAVDIPSGVDGLTGEWLGEPWGAVETVTFQALKPGLLLHPGAESAGRVQVADIGLDVSAAQTHLVERRDVAAWLPRRAPTAHKWKQACWVIAGSPGMTGAAQLTSRAAQRAGAGYVRLSMPGVDRDGPVEAVMHPLPADGWERGLSTDIERFDSVVLGPGLGRAAHTRTAVRAALAAVDTPLVLDGDGLSAIARSPELLRHRHAPTVLTPHDGEYEQLVGTRPGPDRFAAARELASETEAVVLLKGPTTIVADPDGACLAVTEGDARLATAGSGDVLAGIIGALLAGGVPAMRAAAAGAWLHGRAGRLLPASGLVASDLIDVLPIALEEVLGASDLG
jgi:hydroxyethylthiazole kinase-like uncharacterized protein yjeF